MTRILYLQNSLFGEDGQSSRMARPFIDGYRQRHPDRLCGRGEVRWFQGRYEETRVHHWTANWLRTTEARGELCRFPARGDFHDP